LFPLADIFPARKLMSIALVATSLGGFYMATIPSFDHMKILYGIWGATTILIFWAALIRATREWGGHNLQGEAFGFLEGGRGLAAALVGSLAVTLFASLLPEHVLGASIMQLKAAFKQVILLFTIITFLIAIFVWYALPSKNKNHNRTSTSEFSFKKLKTVLKMPNVWLQSVIIVCAYVAYKATDDFSLFAKDVLNYNDVKAAEIGTLSLWMRPVVAVISGILADKFSASKMINFSFILIIIGSLVIGSGFINAQILWLYIIIIITTSLGIFALRALYFAIMEEGKIPLVYTGTVVGILSVIGYTPDIFMGPLMGYVLDSAPGPAGHQHLFLLISGFSLTGLTASIAFRLNSKRKQLI
jgi:MFS family permease